MPQPDITRSPDEPGHPEHPSHLLDRLTAALRPRQRVLTAFSGGVDSTVVAAMARRVLGKAQAPAVIADSASLPRAELAQARQLAGDIDVEFIEVKTQEQDDPAYQANASDRCYFCKTHLYKELVALAGRRKIDYIANGTNLDDLGDHRPGLVAADEAQVISPLIEAQMGKEQVRRVAQHLGLANWDKPAAACLASRLPYGTEVTPQRLNQVEQAEKLLHELGFAGLRVRHHEQVARIELPWQQVPQLMAEPVRSQVIEGLKALGYLYITLDLEGYRTGSGNLSLPVTEHGGLG